MSTSHARSGSGIDVITSTTGEVLLDTVLDVAGRTASQNRIGGHHIVVKRRTPSRLDLAIEGRGGLVTVMTFHAVVTSDNSGQTLLQTGIDGFRTQQSTFMLIPVGKKRLTGLATYEAFTTNLRVALQQNDTAAEVVTR